MRVSLIFLLISVGTVSCYAQDWLWATNFEGPGVDQGNEIAIDENGNIFIAGMFNNTLTIGFQTLTSTGGAAVFIAKLDSVGVPIWAKSIDGHLMGGWGVSLEVDAQGNSIVAGKFQQSIVLGGTTLTPTGPSFNLFITKLDANGNFLWAIQSEGQGCSFNEVHGIFADLNGYIYRR